MRDFFALVPAKDPARGKSRLAPLFDPAERRRLNIALATGTLRACIDIFGAERTLIATSSAAMRRLGEEAGVRPIEDCGPEENMNTALAAAARFALAEGAEGIVIVPTDLPLISPASVRAAVEALPRPPGCVLVPDRHGHGTNLMAISPVSAEVFAFGQFSLRRHAAMAAALGYDVRTFADEALALDLDTPADYECLRAMSALALESCHPG